MSLENKIRESWKKIIAIGGYPITGNFPEHLKDKLEYRFSGAYNKKVATIVSICTNPVLYSMIGGVFFGTYGAEAGLIMSMAEGAIRFDRALSGESPGGLAGIIMTAEEGTTWKERLRKRLKKFTIKWATIGAIGGALAAKLVYDEAAFEQKYKAELNRLNKQEISDGRFESMLNSRENIDILAARIKYDKNVLASLPSEQKAKYDVDKTFLPYYEKDVKPALDSILHDNNALPTIRFGYYEGIKEPLFTDILAFLVLGGGIFACGIQKRFRYSGISFYNLTNSVCDTIDHRSVGISRRMWGAVRSCYHGLAYPINTILTEINLLGLIICTSAALNVVVGLSNSYNMITKQVTITPSAMLNVGKTKEDLAMVLAHESTHAYQDRKNWPVNSTLSEGHARAIEIMCAEEMARKTHNNEWLRGPLNREFVELKAMYYTLCANYSVAPDSDIIGAHDVDAVTKAVYETTAKDGHAKGIALFRVAEHHYGQKVYDEARAGSFSLLIKPYDGFK